MIFSESVGSGASLSANDRKVGWVANECLQPFLFSGWTNLSGAFRDRP